MEHPQLDWNGRVAYLLAREESRQVEIYAMDLLWAIAKDKLVEPKMPSEIWYEKKDDTRSAKEILTDIMDGIGGE